MASLSELACGQEDEVSPEMGRETQMMGIVRSSSGDGDDDMRPLKNRQLD